MLSSDIVSEILAYRPKELSKFQISALQVKPGGYGEGDTLCGTSCPQLRRIARKYANIPDDECEKLLCHNLHEARFVALVILRHKFFSDPEKIAHLYLDNTRHINNWDLVDCSAPYIIGEYMRLTNNYEHVYKLAASDNLWENRIAIVSTLSLIKAGSFTLALELCEKFLTHKHHLIHKACGWMLREISKRNSATVIAFIKDHHNISSITKSYALEWLKKRKTILNNR